jgi:hypothetical protein
MVLAVQDIQHIFERLREGMVPERGLPAFAVGTDKIIGEIKRVMELVSNDEGSSKFLRGGYGCGKTFISQLSLLTALEQNFAVSKVVISSNDTQFYKFDEVYAKIVGNMQTTLTKGGAFADCIDRWIAKVEDRLIDEGEDEDDENFDNLVKERFEQELVDIMKEDAGADFMAVIRHYFILKQEGNISEAQQLLAWLSGSKNISASIKQKAGIKGEITSHSALTYLKGVLQIVKKAGHPGVLVVIDEAETILRMRADVREKSLNGIRQILDATPEFKGLLWMFTGTPDFFDSRKGVAGLQPLDDRIKFRKSGEFVNIKQPQLELKPFNRERLIEVAMRLKELYPSEVKNRIMNKVSDGFIVELVDQMTSGFGGDVGIIPRQFLRELVDILDIVDQQEEYNPAEVYKFDPKDISPEEEQAIQRNMGTNDPKENNNIEF